MASRHSESRHPVRSLSASDAKVLIRLRKICESLPDAVEKVSHGEPTWFAGPKGKVFAMFDNHHHDSPHVSVWLPTPKEIQEALVAAEPAKFFVPPYVGVKGWTGVVLDEDPDWKMVEGLVCEAFNSVRVLRTTRARARPAR